MTTVVQQEGTMSSTLRRKNDIQQIEQSFAKVKNVAVFFM